MRAAGVLATLLALGDAHVPGYEAVDGCARLKHAPSLSQVAYQTVPTGATAGLEFHVRSDTSPIDTTDPEAFVDYDFTFRDKPDPSTFGIYVGCGGCALGDDTPSERLAVDYKPGTVEPFTQTVYRGFQPGEAGDDNRKFPASALSLANCPARHFVLLLRSFPNATEAIHVGFVIGRGEWFTGEELRTFPEWLLLNHGAAWNGLWWTAPLTLLAVLVAINLTKFALSANDVVLDATGLVRFAVDPREIAYEVAVAAYSWASLEVLVHFFYCLGQPDVHVEAFAVLAVLLLVVWFANLVPLTVTLVAWSGVFVADRNTGWLRADVWAPIEILCGIGWLHLLGSGFGVGPLATIAAGLIRLRETKFLGGALQSTAGGASAALAKAGDGASKPLLVPP